MRLSADLGDRMRAPESVIVRWRRATPGSCPRPRGSGPGRDVQRSPRRPCRRGAAETDSKTCLLPCAVRRSAARCSVMSSTTAPTPITASGGRRRRPGWPRPPDRRAGRPRCGDPRCSAAPMPSSAASAWLTSTNRRCRSTIASPTRAAACTSIRMLPVPARCHSVMEALARRSCWILPRGRSTPTPPRPRDMPLSSRHTGLKRKTRFLLQEHPGRRGPTHWPGPGAFFLADSAEVRRAGPIRRDNWLCCVPLHARLARHARVIAGRGATLWRP